jgi:hypothetical protein
MLDFETSVPLTDTYRVEVKDLVGVAYSQAELESTDWYARVFLGAP